MVLKSIMVGLACSISLIAFWDHSPNNGYNAFMVDDKAREDTIKEFFEDSESVAKELYPTIQEMVRSLVETKKKKASENTISQQFFFLEALCREASSRRYKLASTHHLFTLSGQVRLLNIIHQGFYQQTFPVQWKSLMRSLQ